MAIRANIVCVLVIAMVVFGACSTERHGATTVYSDRTTLVLPIDSQGANINATLATIREDLRIAGFNLVRPATSSRESSGLSATLSSDRFKDAAPVGSGSRIEISIRTRPFRDAGHSEWTVSVTADYRPHLGKHPWGGVATVVDHCEATRRRIVDLIRFATPVDPDA
ncbi:MAG: hypothetical protein KF768_00830 [Phycisphaeraceae bacterium]|nr:hypothetical protein [Phycisphaeraceae bacterium]